MSKTKGKAEKQTIDCSRWDVNLGASVWSVQNNTAVCNYRPCSYITSIISI